MHERSLIARLILQIEEELQQRQLSGLKEVRLEIGEFAGVEPELLELAWQELALLHWNADVGLTLDVVPLTAECRQCGQSFHVERFRFVCPVCDHAGVDVVAGEGLRLISLTTEGSGSPEGRS
jgi:hydrogenase nickel incorporation protein HypA/HybF